MTAPHTITSGLAATIGLLALASCHGDRDPTGSPGSSGTTTGAATSTADAPFADSSGGPPDSGCVDDYHGNQSHEAALELVLDSRSSAASTTAPT
jgi:hypothetical protein